MIQILHRPDTGYAHKLLLCSLTEECENLKSLGKNCPLDPFSSDLCTLIEYHAQNRRVCSYASLTEWVSLWSKS